MLHTHSFHCMTTDIELFLEADKAQPVQDALRQVEHFFQEVEARFSRFRPDSELVRLNSAAGKEVRVSADLAELVQLALAAAKASDGVFDPTIIDALEAAGYDRSIDLIWANGAHSPLQIAAQPDRWRQVAVDTTTCLVKLPAGVRLDLGGIAKGWAADRAAAMLQQIGPGMVNAGGDLCAWGDQPGIEKGNGWLVALDHPAQPSVDVAWLRVHDGAVATSSITRRRWAGGHHLIDPRTALPANTDLLSVTAMAPTVAQAEVAAKVVLILGRETGLTWLAEQANAEAVLVGAKGDLFGTPGIKKALV